MRAYQNTPAPKVQPQSLDNLSVNEPDDKYEREADHVAAQVMRMSSGDDPIQRKITPVAHIQRKCAECEEESDNVVQRKPNGTPNTVSPAFQNSLSTTKGGGSPLDGDTRQFMESRMGADFSNVRIHIGGVASQMNQDISARAFTHGSDIYFNQNQYNPETSSGKELLAHELTHVVQQRGVPPVNIQRQHVRMDHGRYVGDTAATPNNLREDVLEVMDILHAMWSLSNTNYNTEYPVVRATPAMSAVPRASIPHTIAALQRNETPNLNPTVAAAQFGMMLAASVGIGATNNRNDIYALQDHLHTHWFLNNTDYATERAAVNSGSDPVSTTTIPQTLNGIRRLRVSRVEQGYHRRDVFTGTRHLSSLQRGRVSGILVPGSTAGGTPPTPDAICSNASALETEIRLTIDPYIQNVASNFRTRRGSPPVLPLAQMQSMADIVEEELERYYGSYLRASTGGAVYNYGQYSVRSQLLDQSASTRWQTPTGRKGWVNYWISEQVGNTHHCNHAAIDAVAHAIATDAAMIADIDTAVQSWPAEATGGININPYLRDATASAAEIRRARWDAFTTILHEALHHLAHRNYKATYRRLQNESMQILKEGVNDLFRRELWSGAGRLRFRIGTTAFNSKRATIEGGSYPYDASVVQYHRDYAHIAQARQIETIVGNENMKAAYFLGHTEYLGLGAGSHGATGPLGSVAPYNAADRGMTNTVVPLSGETRSQLARRVNAPVWSVRTLSGGPAPSSGALSARVRVNGIRYYRSIAGDTIDSIAFQHGLDPYDILRANALTSRTLTAGTRILIPRS